MKKIILVICLLLAVGACFTLKYYKSTGKADNSYKKDIVEIETKLDSHQYGTDIKDSLDTILIQLYAIDDYGEITDEQKQNLYNAIICNLRNELGLLHNNGAEQYKQNGIQIYEATFEQVKTLNPEYKTTLLTLLTKDIQHIYNSKQDWTKEEKALREFVYNLQNADDTFDWYKIYTVIPPDTDRNEHTIRPLGG